MSQEELFRTADVISLHLRLTPETKNSIGREQLGWMKPTAYLINTARAAVSDQKDLVEALQNGTIHGAALDGHLGAALFRQRGGFHRNFLIGFDA